MIAFRFARKLLYIYIYMYHRHRNARNDDKAWGMNTFTDIDEHICMLVCGWMRQMYTMVTLDVMRWRCANYTYCDENKTWEENTEYPKQNDRENEKKKHSNSMRKPWMIASQFIYRRPVLDWGPAVTSIGVQTGLNNSTGP